MGGLGVASVSRQAADHRAACRRASALALGLGQNLDQLVADRASGAAGRARARDTLWRIDAALGVGLAFKDALDPQLAYRRGHARNVALVLRRTIEAALANETPAARQTELLALAIRFTEELAETVTWIGQSVADLAHAPALRPWSSSWAGRLLAMAAWLLPREQRQDFIEDQCGNLSTVASRREWVTYLLGLLTDMPRIAAASISARAKR